VSVAVPNPEELQTQADAIQWFHSIELAPGVRTKGLTELALTPDQLPDLAGRSVLDIGAWDGYYSFLAERAGASRVVALDHYAWGVDFVARGAYWAECIEKGVLPDQDRDTTDFWRSDLPGRRGFEFAHRVLDSKVEPVVADFMTVDLDELGTFDVVLYLGVLYHMKEPLTALERVRRVTGAIAVIETEAVHFQDMDHEPLLQFHAGSDMQVDFGNWFVPTAAALRALSTAAGFSRVETVTGPPSPPAPPEPAPPPWARLVPGRARPPAPSTSPPTCAYRAVVHAHP